MREMKNCGIPTFGHVPKSWEICKLKSLLTLKSEKNSGDRELLSVYLDKGVISYSDSTGMQVHKPSVDLSNYQNVSPGDFVLNNQQAWRGSVGVSKYSGIISPAYFVYSMNSKCHPPYMNYVLRDTSMVQQYETSSRGVGTIQRNIFAPWLLQCQIVLPSLTEQKSIASYLDTKCAEIDALTANIQTQIDTLKQYKRSIITEAVTKGLNPAAEMKDSGIFYLGKVNHNWRLTKIGYVCTKLTRSFEPSDTALICSNKGKVLIRDANMTGIMVSEDNAMQGIKRGDIAIHGMDTWHGAIALSDYDGKITRVVHVCDSTEDKRFIVYWLQYLAFQGVYKLISNGVRGNTSDFRSWDKVSDISIALPQTKEEQHKICDYLDNICLEAESIINQKKEQIDILESYKKSLIYEYVTGKKEVPAAESDVIAVVLDPHIIMLGLAIDKLGKDIKGKTQLQKILYLLDEYLGFTHSTQYYRYAHGPYDLQLNNYIDALTNNHWYEHQRHGADILVKGTNHNNFVAEHGNVFAEKNAEVDKLINFLKPMKTSQVERIATLFAAWNDFIIDGNANPTDDQIINEVMTNWTPNKGHTQYTTWQSTLAKMKQHSIIPKGKGLHTLPMPKKENTDE